MTSRGEESRWSSPPMRNLPVSISLVGIHEITAKGPHITIDLSGVRTVDYTEKDPAIEQAGFIALQVHMNHSMEVQFKDILIKEL
jgi:hypothetical protein